MVQCGKGTVSIGTGGGSALASPGSLSCPPRPTPSELSRGMSEGPVSPWARRSQQAAREA